MFLIDVVVDIDIDIFLLSISHPIPLGIHFKQFYLVLLQHHNPLRAPVYIIITNFIYYSFKYLHLYRGWRQWGGWRRGIAFISERTIVRRGRCRSVLEKQIEQKRYYYYSVYDGDFFWFSILLFPIIYSHEFLMLLLQLLSISLFAFLS